MVEEIVGKVTHYFDRIGVAVIALVKPLKVGDQISFKGHNEFTQTVTSMQIEHQAVNEAQAGQEVAVKVDQPVKKNDQVFSSMA